MTDKNELSSSPVKAVVKHGLHWPLLDPFLFYAHHHDVCPASNENLGDDESRCAGRNVDSSFVLKVVFRMFPGTELAGFPRHPHRVFKAVNRRFAPRPTSDFMYRWRHLERELTRLRVALFP